MPTIELREPTIKKNNKISTVLGSIKGWRGRSIDGTMKQKNSNYSNKSDYITKKYYCKIKGIPMGNSY